MARPSILVPLVLLALAFLLSSVMLLCQGRGGIAISPGLCGLALLVMGMRYRTGHI